MKKICFLGNELNQTRSSSSQFTDMVDSHSKVLVIEIREIKGFLARTGECKAYLTQNMVYLQQLQECFSNLSELHTHMKSYRAVFYAYKIAFFSTFFSLAAGYANPQFLLSHQLVSIVNEHVDDEILRCNKLYPLVCVGQEIIYHEIPIFSKSPFFECFLHCSGYPHEFQVFRF